MTTLPSEPGADAQRSLASLRRLRVSALLIGCIATLAIPFVQSLWPLALLWTFEAVAFAAALPASAQSSISATYNRAGSYEVTVFVSDAEGLSSFATTRIRIDARLDTSVWTLASLNAQPLLPGTAITLQFKDGELAGFAGCNSYSGRYTAELAEDGYYTISIGPLTTSLLLCPPDIMQQEQAFLSALQQASRATVQQNRIVLDSPAGNLEFYLVEED
jgi:heat shock protein HslJ